MTRPLLMSRWLACAIGGIAVIAAVGAYWGASSELLNRSLIVAASVWLLFRAIAMTRSDEGSARDRAIGMLLLVAALVALPPASFLIVQMGPRPVLLWWVAVSWLAAVAGQVLLLHGRAMLRAVAFPLLFLLFALPIPQRIEGPFQHTLQGWTTTVSAWLLQQAGFQCARHGFVLSLPGGDLGVLEACSGIRSVTALAAMAAFLAYRGGMNWLRGSGFMFTVVPVVVFVNVVRVTVSGVLQEMVGPQAVQGTPHEMLGFAAVLLGLAALWGLSRLAAGEPGYHTISEFVENSGAKRAKSWNSIVVIVFSVIALTGNGAAVALGLRTVDEQQHAVPLEQVAMTLGEWQGEDLPVPETIREMLTYDRVLHRVYRSQLGQDVHVWVIFWSGSGSVRGYHHPDVCWPNRGWTVTERRVHRLAITSASDLPMAVRRYRDGENSQMICYWSQEGGRVWTDADEGAAHAEGTPRHRWIGERLRGKRLGESGRLSVLLGTDLWGSGNYAEQSLLSFGERFANELYRVLPWAVPVPANEVNMRNQEK